MSSKAMGGAKKYPLSLLLGAECELKEETYVCPAKYNICSKNKW